MCCKVCRTPSRHHLCACSRAASHCGYHIVGDTRSFEPCDSACWCKQSPHWQPRAYFASARHSWRCQPFAVVELASDVPGKDVLFLSFSVQLCTHSASMFDTYESRAETHERFGLIEVHSHRFEMSARKVPFEKCTRWRKVCGRSAKDQIYRRYSLYSFFYDFARKVRDRRVKYTRKTYPLEPCPAQNGQHLCLILVQGKRTTYHNDILVASIHSCKQKPIHCLVCIRVCLIRHIWFLLRIKLLENATVMGPRKEAKDSR